MLGGGDELTAIDPRIAALRWLDTLPHPPVEVDQHRALDMLDSQGISFVLGHRRRPRRRSTVGRAVGHEVTNIGVERRVPGAGRIGVNERCRPRPVLERVVRHDDLRQRTEAFRLHQHVVAGWRTVRQEIERRVVCGHGVALEIRGMMSRLGEAVVETALAAAGDVDPRPLEDHSLGLIDVEALPQHVDDETPRLRNAEDVGVVDHRFPAAVRTNGEGARCSETVGALEVEEGDGVAHRRQAEADDSGVLDLVDQLVDKTGLNAPFDRERGRVGDPDAVFHPGEAPPIIWNRDPGAIRHAAEGEHRVAVVTGIERWIAAAVAPRQGHRRRRRQAIAVDDFGRDALSDGLPIFGGDGQLDLQAVVSGTHIPVPCRPQQRVTLPHQEAIARVLRRGRIVGPVAIVDVTQHVQVATIVDVVEKAAVPLCEVDRFEEEEVALETDLAVGASGRELEVDDRRVGRVVRVNGVEELAPDLLVGPGLAELHAVGKDRTRGDFDPLDLRDRDGRDNEQSDDKKRDHSNESDHSNPPRTGIRPRASLRARCRQRPNGRGGPRRCSSPCGRGL